MEASSAAWRIPFSCAVHHQTVMESHVTHLRRNALLGGDMKQVVIVVALHLVLLQMKECIHRPAQDIRCQVVMDTVGLRFQIVPLEHTQERNGVARTIVI